MRVCVCACVCVCVCERERILGILLVSSARIAGPPRAQYAPDTHCVRVLSIQVSVAAQDLIDFTKSRQDPFHPEHSPAENPWIGGSKSGRSLGRIG